MIGSWLFEWCWEFEQGTTKKKSRICLERDLNSGSLNLGNAVCFLANCFVALRIRSSFQACWNFVTCRPKLRSASEVTEVPRIKSSLTYKLHLLSDVSLFVGSTSDLTLLKNYVKVLQILLIQLPHPGEWCYVKVLVRHLIKVLSHYTAESKSSNRYILASSCMHIQKPRGGRTGIG